MIRLIKVFVVLILLVFVNNSAVAGDSLMVHCKNSSGKLVLNHFINNINFKGREKIQSGDINAFQILYDKQWYQVTGDAATYILSTAEMGLVLNLSVDMCVDTTRSPNQIIGIQFTRNF